ncbi:TM1802 family CRISPR-associated protein [Arcicella rosea]|uniref:CRISPR-associated protein Csh1 n=1 Tax=Arcicella rosea TaxID=502909 RepID=A0A841ENK2_9BACT|nr:TM1802 family CRISPR-associated protein [Arcicella rosea]MBB6002603.1 CRISPR-associated protein Csh1 [Arcicella rosea]
MLTTLIKLGSQLSHNRGEWDDIIDYPNILKEKDKNIKLYVAELVFDLDKCDVYLSPSLKEYDEEKSCLVFKNIKIQGGNNKAIYACVESGKLEQIRKTFFGAIDSKGNIPSTGQFQEAISKDFPQFNDTRLGKLLPKIFSLSNIFIEKFTIEKEAKGQVERLIDEKLLTSLVLQSPFSRIILFYTSVLSSEDGINMATPVSKIEGFEEFMKAKFLEKGKKQTSIEVSKKLCYATGTLNSDVAEVNFSDRYSLNKMFVKETKNYASFFDKNSFILNYQVSNNNQLLLSRASKYLLENQKIRIAGIDHCIIPQFLNKEEVDIQYITKGIFQKSELLFDSNSFDSLVTGAEYETDAPFWITFLAFESDGNFFKTINEIKDVSKFHFYKIIESFNEVNDFFKNDLQDSVDWLSVMTDYGKQHRFNLASIYSIIPIRKDKEKKNEVLSLFKLIFENRKIDSNKLFKHFCDLILCHRYERYKSFKNVKEYDDQYFDFAVRDSVFKYFALIQALKQLNLLQNMEENEIVTPETSEDKPNEYQQKITTFFTQMGYNVDQMAMFYLGRMLKNVVKIQDDKVKTVFSKVNFNGMSVRDIMRLRVALIEKTEQYKKPEHMNKIQRVKFDDVNFVTFFKEKDWEKRMSRERAIFFILSGYSFGIVKSSENK